tara:strand:- start:277 stop:420 length:144 start_codon:yes stop_codon:yes gene_type:complete
MKVFRIFLGIVFSVGVIYYLSEKEYLLAGSNLIFLFLFSLSSEIYKK